MIPVKTISDAITENIQKNILRTTFILDLIAITIYNIEKIYNKTLVVNTKHN